MSPARAVRAPVTLVPTRRVHARRIVATALALSLLVGAIPTARAAVGDGSSESKVGVLAAVLCGLALKFSIPAPVPWVGVAVASCAFAFLDAAGSPDDSAPAKP